MDRNCRIGQFAKEAGVPASTLRFYERKGLLAPDERTEGNYRLYGPSDLERVRFIRAAQDSGFSLDDIGKLIDFRDGVTAPCGDIEELIVRRLAGARAQMKSLKDDERQLAKLLDLCRSSGRGKRCKAMDRLATD